MALISCPHCGKRITDRTEVCPHCQTVLIQKNDTVIVSKASVLSDGKKNILSVAIATVEAFVFTRLIGTALGIICNYFMGESGKRAFRDGSNAFQGNALIISVVGLVVLCVLPIILKKTAKMNSQTVVIAISVILALIFGISYCSRTSAYRLFRVYKDAIGNYMGEDIFREASFVPFYYAVTIPLYQGMFFLLNYGKNGKKGYIGQAVFAAIALVITVILAVVLVAFFCMGTQGAAFAGALASLLMFIVASLRKK